VAGSVRLPTSSGEKLALKRHHRLFIHLLPYDYPDFTLSGGAGVAVLRTARAAADRPFRQSIDNHDNVCLIHHPNSSNR
jgi:hypothetical protein